MWKKLSGLLIVSLMATGLAACAGADDNNRVERNNVNNVRPLDMDNDIRRGMRDMDMNRNGRNGFNDNGAGTGMNGRNGTMTDRNGRSIDRSFDRNTTDTRNGRGMMDPDMNPLDADNDDILPDQDDRMNRNGGMMD